jgi:hypothetical protein
MSSRVLRDDLWTSEPIGRLHDKTFRLYVCLINAADDYGLVETAFGHIRRAAPLSNWTSEEVAKMLGELFDAEVLLPYKSLDKTFAAIDKWQCFMRSVKPRCPIPSFGLGHIRMPFGFKNARVRECAALLLKHLDIKGTTPGSPRGVSRDDLGHEGNRELGVGSREEGKKKKRKKPPLTPPLFDWPCPDIINADAWAAWLEVRNRLGAPMTEFGYKSTLRQIRSWASDGYDPNEAIAASASNGWRGIFKPKQKSDSPIVVAVRADGGRVMSDGAIEY